MVLEFCTCKVEQEIVAGKGASVNVTVPDTISDSHPLFVYVF